VQPPIPLPHSAWGGPSRVTRCLASPRQQTLVLCALVALGLWLAARLVAMHLPITRLISSSTGWTILLVTTLALGGSLMPVVRRLGEGGGMLGYPCLYLVLAATGAQANLEALTESPAWLLVGAWTVVVHAALLLLSGRIFRIPFGVLATASQANLGGVVSAPLVGAVYDQRLVPVGLLLAIVGNAVGTYLGLCAASVDKILLGGD